MKKVKFEGKLNLNKETIANLNNEQMNSVKGGQIYTSGCSDGCGALRTWFLCTNANCTADCTNNSNNCPTR